MFPTQQTLILLLTYCGSSCLSPAPLPSSLHDLTSSAAGWCCKYILRIVRVLRLLIFRARSVTFFLTRSVALQIPLDQPQRSQRRDQSLRPDHQLADMTCGSRPDSSSSRRLPCSAPRTAQNPTFLFPLLFLCLGVFFHRCTDVCVCAAPTKLGSRSRHQKTPCLGKVFRPSDSDSACCVHTSPAERVDCEQSIHAAAQR